MKNEDTLDDSCCLIDEFNLDKECIRQPRLYLQAATIAAEKRLLADQLKNAMEVIEAEVQMRIRSKPEKYNIEKITEAAISAAVLQHEKFKAAQNEYLLAKHQENLASALVGALDQKKRALTLLVNLHGTSYFAEVKPSSEGREAVEDMTRKKTRRAVERHRNKEIDREDDNDE